MQSPTLLYIDPGTGSILFTILLGSAAAFYFLVKALFFRTKAFLAGKNTPLPDDYYPIVIYNEGRQYWNVFKPVLDEFEKRGTAVMYFTSSRDDPFFDEDFIHITGKYIGEGVKAFTFLNFLKADVVLMTTPGLEVYQLKRSRQVKHYSHILHDPGDVTCYRLFGTDWFDSILLSGAYQKEDLVELERIRGTPAKEYPVIGCTYLDVLDEKRRFLTEPEDHPFTVLVSPSWGPGSLLAHFGSRLLDPLTETDWRIIIRPHPQSTLSEKNLVANLERRYQNNSLLTWDFSGDNIASLAQADIMISDFSSVIFDYIFLFRRPVVFANSHFNLEIFDASDLDHAPWKFRILKEIGREITDRDIDSVTTIIEEAAHNTVITKKFIEARETAWQYPGEGGRRAVDFLAAKQKMILSKREGSNVRSP
jgi:hypothetical protein